MVTIGDDRLEGRACDHASSRTRLTGADALVVGVEEEIELRIERTVAGEIRFENHPLEKPRRVREMPLSGTCVGYRLDGRVSVGQRGAEARACFAHGLIERAEIGVSLRRAMRLRDTHAILVLF